MIYEAVVTSAPRGLQAGRTGFCTVLRTRGTHPELGNRLEAASGYRHVHPQGDPRNPLIRTHVVMQTPVGQMHVLSRIVDAGNDYSGRTNKLAHHLALDAGEVSARAKSSPAAVLLALEREGRFLRQWTGEPRETPAPPAVTAPAAEPGPCQAWARVAGDAGWAGFIADRALRNEPTWIIVPPGGDPGLQLLELFAEALALVNYQQRWGVTFTTFATAAGGALWLGTTSDSPEAQAARGQTRIAVVDLTRREPCTAPAALVAAARTGAVSWKREAARPLPAAPAGGVPVPPGGIVQPGAPTPSPSLPATPFPRPTGGVPSLTGGPPVLPGSLPTAGGWGGPPSGGFSPSTPLAPAPPPPDDEIYTRRGGVPAWVWGVIATVLLAIGGTVTVVVLKPEILKQVQVAWRRGDGEPEKPKSDKPKSDKPKSDKPKSDKPKSDKPKPAEPKPAEPTPADPKPADPTPATPTPADPTPADPTPADPTPSVDRAAAQADRKRNEAKSAFDEDIANAIRDRDHMPLLADAEKGFDASDSSEQTITLCRLGKPSCPIELTVAPNVGNYTFACRRDGDRWLLETTPSLNPNADPPLQVGHASLQSNGGQKDTALVLTLAKQLPHTDKRFAESAFARLALATGAVAVCHGEYPDDPDFQTFVQTTRPREQHFAIDGFFFQPLWRKENPLRTKKETDDWWILPPTPHRLFLVDSQGCTSAGDQITTQIGQPGTLLEIKTPTPADPFIAIGSWQFIFDGRLLMRVPKLVFSWGQSLFDVRFSHMDQCDVPLESACNLEQVDHLQWLPKRSDIASTRWPLVSRDDVFRLGVTALLRDLGTPGDQKCRSTAESVLKYKAWPWAVDLTTNNGKSGYVSWDHVERQIPTLLETRLGQYQEQILPTLLEKYAGDKEQDKKAKEDPEYKLDGFRKYLRAKIQHVNATPEQLIARTLVALESCGAKVREDYDRAYQLVKSLDKGDFWLTGKLVAPFEGKGLPPGMRAVLVEFVPPESTGSLQPEPNPPSSSDFETGPSPEDAAEGSATSQ